MAKNYKQSFSLFTKCFRFNKTISTPILSTDSDLTTITSLSKTSPLSSIIEAIHTIDQLIPPTEGNCQGDSHCLQKPMNLEQIEQMLIKWTHIAHFLIDTYQQAMTENNLN